MMQKMEFGFAVFAVVAVGITAQGQNGYNDLCYSLIMSGTSRTLNIEFAPVTGFPATHPAVAQGACGVNYSTGDRIPRTARYPTSSDGVCSDAVLDGGQIFYSYNWPRGASSNTGFTKSNAAILYFVVDAGGRLSLVLTFDEINDGSGGTIQLSVNSPELVGYPDVDFGVRDDLSEPQCNIGSRTRPCEWNHTTGIVENMTWTWASCCTDGMAFTDLPFDGTTIAFNFGSATRGIDEFKIAQWNNNTTSISFLDLDATTVLQSGFTLRTESCSDYCSSILNCGDCSLSSNCAWCDATATCSSAFDLDVGNVQCSGSRADSATCCSVCTDQTSCSACTGTVGCGWDFSTATCVSAKTVYNDTITCQGHLDFFAFKVDQCMPCGGPHYNSTDGSLIWCNGNGICDWQSQSCSCDTGWTGSDCSSECPGGVDNPCNQHGTCVEGGCICNCGWSGDSCSEEGCPCQTSNPAESVCTIGECDTVCGRRQSDNSCTGFGIGPPSNLTCACRNGWWGFNCTLPCPGVQQDGSGSVCGGRGTCEVDGSCTCPACYHVASNGTCVEDDNLACANFGFSTCTSVGKVCSCNGVWNGPTCENCPCPSGIACNPISGDCQYTRCNSSQYVASPPSLTSDTVCLTVRPGCNFSNGEFEVAAPTHSSDRLCRPIQNCSQEQFERAAPTATSDRMCVQFNMCSPLQYESVRATNTSDRVCTELQVCGASEYVSLAATATSDRSCTQLSICSSDEYESVQPSASTDRVCLALLECNSSQYVRLQPTTTSNRVCQSIQSCNGSSYESIAPSSTTDRACSSVRICSSDEFILSIPTDTSDRVCSSYQVCDRNQFEISPGTRTTDRACSQLTRPCNTDQYESTPPTLTSDRLCAALSVCTINEFESVIPTSSSDRECTPVSTRCAINQFLVAQATATSDRSCAQVRNCISSQQFIEVQATSTSDRVCSALRTCSRMEFESAPPTPTTNRLCTLISNECTNTEFDSSQPTATSDRICIALRICTTSEFEAVAPTTSTNRICAQVSGSCSRDEFVLAQPTATTDRTCKTVRMCGDSEFEQNQPTSTSDRICSTIRTCDNPEVEVMKPTATSNRICKQKHSSMQGSPNDGSPNDGVSSSTIIAIVLVLLLMVVAVSIFFILAAKRRKAAFSNAPTPTSFDNPLYDAVSPDIEEHSSASPDLEEHSSGSGPVSFDNPLYAQDEDGSAGPVYSNPEESENDANAAEGYMSIEPTAMANQDEDEYINVDGAVR